MVAEAFSLDCGAFPPLFYRSDRSLFFSTSGEQGGPKKAAEKRRTPKYRQDL
jgi:hypothetical protein